MSDRIETIKSFIELGFKRLGMVTENLKEEQLDWKYCPQANNVRWLLTHLSNELHVYIPKILKGDKDYYPEGWPEDYTGNTGYSLEKIRGDLEEGKKKLLKSLEETADEALDEEMDWFWGKLPKLSYLNLMVSEILHHEGQIAAILGVEKRIAD
ncbi:MAG: DinB family protein [Candidatus Hermodarchaeia archaeon]|jgi:uncharacterized damage-inducible protein DinB